MINWFRKKEIDTSFVNNCVPVTIKEVEVYRKKIRTLLEPYIGDNEKDNRKLFRKVGSKYGIYPLTLEKFYHDDNNSYLVMAKLVKKLKDAGL